jgi:TetR/AcrR family transcriptional regulator
MTREEVRAHQRDRIFRALETVMAPKGYAETSVADIIRGAGVSRQTFYELFSSKQDCFLASYSSRQGALLQEMVGKPAGGSPIERLSLLLDAYLTVMAMDPDLSRLYLIGVYTPIR